MVGTAGRFLFIATVVIQIAAIVLAFVVRGLATTWYDGQARAASIIAGWIGALAGLIWSFWACFSLLEIGDGELGVFTASCALFIVALVGRPRSSRRSACSRAAF